MRKSDIVRNTNETRISLSLDIDGKGAYEINTGCGFLDHMLELFTRHGRFDIKLVCDGDVHVDYHHTTEDTGIDVYKRQFLEGFAYCEANDSAQLEKLVDDDTCAIMMEMIQGEGGVLNLEKEFVETAERLCKEKDMLLIVDEVQTGIGRSGRLFAYEHFGIKPDIVTFAKGDVYKRQAQDLM